MRAIAPIVVLCMARLVHAAEVGDVVREPLIDLSNNDTDSLPENTSKSHVLANPWWQNFDIYGFAAAGFYDTGADGTRANGGFEIKEASLFVEASVWENTAFHIELQTNRLGKDDSLFTRTGEVYLHFRDVAVSGNWKIGIKAGRIDIPFGEEYLWQDSIDNPLITNSAAYPYGWDEGLLAYGKLGVWSWIASITDGTDVRSRDDNSEKAINLKLSSQLSKSLYLSFSGMSNGDGAKSAIEFGGSHFEPVGASHSSAAGVSASPQVGAALFQLDAKYEVGVFADQPAHVTFSVGFADQHDDDATFDRSLRWFSIEPTLSMGRRSYLVLRYSEIGTYNSNEGYHFDGKTFAGGNSAFGYDTKRFRRLAIGAGWRPNPRVVAKIELGKDWFTLIDAALTPNTGQRKFVGIELAAKF